MATFDDAVKRLRLEVKPAELADIVKRLADLSQRVPPILDAVRKANATGYLDPDCGRCALGSSHVTEVPRLSGNMTDTFMNVLNNVTGIADALGSTGKAVTGHAAILAKATGKLEQA